jgi:hypothetical protein
VPPALRRAERRAIFSHRGAGAARWPTPWFSD